MAPSTIAATAGACWMLSGRGQGPRPLRVQGSALALLLLVSPARAAVTSVYLIQNSGWMEPFYTDARAPFRPLLGALVAASQAGGEVVVADFDQDGQLVPRRSPHVDYRGPDDPARIDAAIAALDLPVQANGHLTDADFDGALVRGINTVLDGRPGIVWLVTNNRNSPGNSQRVDENTRDFARRLADSPALPLIVAYPVRLAAQGREYSANGLIIYGIAYGDEAAVALRRLTRAPGLTRLFADPAVQLKPLDQAPLAFTPLSSTTPGLVADRLPDGSLRIAGVPGGRASSVEIAGALRSDYYPHEIDGARLSLRWEGGAGIPNLDATIDPAILEHLAPGQAAPVRLRLAVPQIDRARGPAGWLQRDVTLHGVLRIELGQLSLSLAPAFAAKVSQIAALDQLPAVFFDNRAVTAATASLPVTLTVHFSAWPLIRAVLGLLLALALLALVLVMLRREREHVVSLDGQMRRVRLRPFQTRQLTLPNGQAFRVRGRLAGPPSIHALPVRSG